MAEKKNGIETTLEGAALKSFLSKYKKFEERFNQAMFRGEDFTIRLEVRGNQGKLLHVRFHEEEFDRPSD